MSICPMCKTNYALFREMTAVVVAAETLVDKAAGDPFIRSDVAEAGATLSKMVNVYRETVERFEARGGQDVVQ